MHQKGTSSVAVVVKVSLNCNARAESLGESQKNLNLEWQSAFIAKNGIINFVKIYPNGYFTKTMMKIGNVVAVYRIYFRFDYPRYEFWSTS